MALVALLSLSLVLFFFPKNITLTQAQCLPDQRHALIQLKQSFYTNELYSWNASIDCCIWGGITCDEKTGMVTALNLCGMHISGEINPALFNLSSLQYLDLSFNYFFGPLPQTVFERLANLTHLDLSQNSMLSGQLPEFKKQSSLEYLSLSGTNFTGPLPDSIGNLKYLSELDLSDCNFYREVPPSITNLRRLHYLDLGLNRLTGEIPEEIGQLESLYVLNLAHNALAGRIPSELASLDQLRSLDLSSNQLSGPIPHELASLTSLVSLNLSYNNLAGEVPEFLVFSNDSYLGNPGLCGNPLSMQCARAPSNIGFIVSIGVGLYLGFATVIWALVYWENGRKWFILITDKFYFRHFH